MCTTTDRHSSAGIVPTRLPIQITLKIILLILTWPIFYPSSSPLYCTTCDHLRPLFIQPVIYSHQEYLSSTSHIILTVTPQRHALFSISLKSCYITSSTLVHTIHLRIQQILPPHACAHHRCDSDRPYTSSTQGNPLPLSASDLHHHIYVEPTILQIFSTVLEQIHPPSSIPQCLEFFDLIAFMLAHTPCHKSLNLPHFFLILSVYVLSSLLFLSCIT